MDIFHEHKNHLTNHGICKNTSTVKNKKFRKFRERFLLLKHGPKHVVSLEKSSYPNSDSS